MTDKEKFKLNIQLFGGEEGGEPTPNPVGHNDPTGEEGELGNPLQGSGGEPTPNPEPQLTWENFNSDDYKDIDIAESVLNECKEKNYSPEFAKIMLESRKAYIEAERNNMSPELKAALPAINNFISAEKNTNRQAVYKAMVINAEGAAILKDYMEMKAGSTGSVAGVGRTQSSANAYTRESFIETYNKALDTNDQALMQSLKTYASTMREQDSFYYDFIN